MSDVTIGDLNNVSPAADQLIEVEDDPGGTPAPGSITLADLRTFAQVGVVLASLFDANTILKADSDNTPETLTVAEDRVVGRVQGGEITDLTGAQIASLLADLIDTTQLADAAVTLAKMANLAEGTYIGRADGSGTGVPQALATTDISSVDAAAAIVAGDTVLMIQSGVLVQADIEDVVGFTP